MFGLGLGLVLGLTRVLSHLLVLSDHSVPSALLCLWVTTAGIIFNSQKLTLTLANQNVNNYTIKG